MGGSSGGGGSSGAVDYPGYLKTYHGDYLGYSGINLGQLALEAIQNNPYTSALAYNPATPLAAIAQEASWFKGLVQQLGSDEGARWAEIFQTVATAVKQSVDDLDLLEFDPEASVDAFNEQITSVLESTTLPKFRAGMRDIGAVQSSAFVIGEALLWEAKDREVAKYAADLNYKQADTKSRILAELTKSGVSDALTLLARRIEASQNAMHYGIEAKRLEIVSMKEYQEKEVEYDSQDAMWTLEVTEYINHGIAAIAGAATTSSGKKANSTQSAIGGALMGAGVGAYMAAGTAVGGPIGAAIGGAVGLGAGLLMG